MGTARLDERAYGCAIETDKSDAIAKMEALWLVSPTDMHAV